MTGKYKTLGANAMLILVCLVVIQQCSAQTVHVVGGSTGWNFPSSSSFYSTWAASQTFRVGDVLEFNFPTGSHSVATVTKSAYVNCNTTGPLALSTTGPFNITVKSGTQYFICTFPGHCNGGLKLTVTASAPSPSPAVAPSPHTTAPSPSPHIHAPEPSPRTAAPGPRTASKSPKKAPAASPSSNPAVSPTPSSTPAATNAPPTVSSAPAEGPGGAAPSPSPSSAPPAAAAGVLISIVSVSLAILF